MPDLANNNAWNLIFEGGAAQLSPVHLLTREKINLIFTPLFTRPYIKAFVSSDLAKPTWRWGGYFYLYAGTIFSSQPLLASIKSCFLNQWNLLDFPMLDSTENQTASSWHVRYESPYWFKEVDISVYQYYDG
jgi:hypothetical protein